MSTTPPEGTPVLRRPNGRPQACEPCHKRKVACDHAQPVCNRCRRRNQERDCRYAGADARGGRLMRPAATRVSGSPASPPRSANQLLPRTRLSSATASRSEPPASPSSDLPVVGSGAFRPGYLGFSSFHQVFEETQNSLSQLQGPTPSSEDACQAVHSHSIDENSFSGVMSRKTKEMCLTVLQSVPDAVKAGKIFRSHSNPHEGWIHSVAKRLHISLFETFGHLLGVNRDPVQLDQLARTLCVNTLKPISDDVSDPWEWIEQFSGRNFRWESLGVLFSFWDISHSAMAMVWAPELEGWSPIVRDCLGLCVDLCKEFSQGNVFMLSISYKRAITESMFVGEASQSVWRSHGETVALLTFLGLHAETGSDTEQHSLSLEAKRRIAAYIYSLDKVMTSFTGRPPFISHHYFFSPLPLDLQDQDLFKNKEELAESIQTLDENGWNTKGEVYSATIIRARFIIARLREDVLQIALGNPKKASAKALKELREQELQNFAAFPAVLNNLNEDFEPVEMNIQNLYAKLLIRLEHLQNLFFIERLLLRVGEPDTGELLRISFELVVFTLPFWTHVDKLAAVRVDSEWIVLAYAAPAGGILCMELLKPTFEHRHPTDPKITRSSIVQKLSLLVGFMDWVHPSSPNGDLCAKCKYTIQHVLDQALNNPQVNTSNSLPWDFSAQVDFDFDLIDTFEWSRPD